MQNSKYYFYLEIIIISKNPKNKQIKNPNKKTPLKPNRNLDINLATFSFPFRKYVWEVSQIWWHEHLDFKDAQDT